jgi:hypothetical protein
MKELGDIKNISDINIDTTEGKLLIATLGRLTSLPGYSNKRPDEVLREMAEVAKEFE